MKRITAVFPTRAEAEAAYDSLRSTSLVQGAITLLADSSHQVNPNTDNSRSSDGRTSQAPEVPLIVPVGGVAGSGTGMGMMGGILPPNVVTGSISRAGGDDMPSTTGDNLEISGNRQTGLDTPGVASSKPLNSATLEGFQDAGFSAEEAQYYSSAVSQGHAVLSVELDSEDREASVRQIISQNDGHPFAGGSQ